MSKKTTDEVIKVFIAIQYKYTYSQVIYFNIINYDSQ